MDSIVPISVVDKSMIVETDISKNMEIIQNRLDSAIAPIATITMMIGSNDWGYFQDLHDYFYNYVTRTFNDSVELLLIRDWKDTAGIEYAKERISQYDLNIVCGVETFKLLDPKHPSSNLPVYKLSANPPIVDINGIHKKLNIINSPGYYLHKQHIITFYMEIVNLLGLNPGIKDNGIASKFNPQFFHISKLTEIYVLHFKNSECYALDYETNGSLPYWNGCRAMGFSLAHEDYQAYFYYSKDNETYQKELESALPIIDWIFKSDQHKIWTFNNSFENGMTHYLLEKQEIFFQDTRIFTHMLKTRGSLKHNASIFLDIPEWTEELYTFANMYDTFKSWYELHQSYLTNDDINADTMDKIKEYFFHENFPLANNKSSHEEQLQTKEWIWSGLESFTNKNADFDINNMLDYIANGWNFWHACDYKTMGYYCNLDTFYTFLLKRVIFDSNYMGVATGYHFYHVQSNLAGMMEDNGIKMDEEYFRDFKAWSDTEMHYRAKMIMQHPKFVEAYVDAQMESTIYHTFRRILDSKVVAQNGGKKVVGAVVELIANIKHVNLVEEYFKLLETITEMSTHPEFNNLTASKKKTWIRGALKNKGLWNADGLYLYLEIFDKRVSPGLISTMAPEIAAQFIRDKLLTIHDESYDEALTECNRDQLVTEFTAMVENSATFEELDRYAGFFSTLPEKRKILLHPLFHSEDMKMYIFRRMLIGCYWHVKDKFPEFYDTITAVPGNEFIDHLEELGKIAPNVPRDSKDRKYTLPFSELVQMVAGWTEDIVEGRKLDKGFLREVKQAWESVNGAKGSLEEYPLDMQYLYHLVTLRKANKTRTSMINGKLGGGSAIWCKRNKANVPIRYRHLVPGEDTPEGMELFYCIDFRACTLETYRWSSGFHTIPSEVDFNVAFTTRFKDDGMYAHSDAAQSEVRVVMAVADEWNMIVPIKDGLDIHSRNAIMAFNLDCEVHEVKEKYGIERNASKILTFSILYQAGVQSIANQAFDGNRKAAEDAQDLYFKANPKLNDHIINTKAKTKADLGFQTVPLFEHTTFVSNPYHHSVEQVSINWGIQNLSSSINAILAWYSYLDLRRKGYEVLMTGFIHDAIEFDFHTKEMFVVYDIMEYWFVHYPYDTWFIPLDIDPEVGINKQNKAGLKYKYNEDFTEVTMSLIFLEYVGHEVDTYRRLMSNSFDCISLEINKIPTKDGSPRIRKDFYNVFEGYYAYDKTTLQVVEWYSVDATIKVTWDVDAAKKNREYRKIDTSKEGMIDRRNKLDAITIDASPIPNPFSKYKIPIVN